MVTRIRSYLDQQTTPAYVGGVALITGVLLLCAFLLGLWLGGL